MKVSLLPKLARFVEDQVKAGRFNTADDVVNGALARLQAEQELSAAGFESLCGQVAIGLAQADRGELEPWDPQEIDREVERRLSAEQAAGHRRNPDASNPQDAPE